MAASPSGWRTRPSDTGTAGYVHGQALALTWLALDLERGAIRLDTNKTDEPRAWVMEAGTRAAIQGVWTTYGSRSRGLSNVGDVAA